MCIYICTYTYLYTHVYIYIYVFCYAHIHTYTYIYIEREREKETQRDGYDCPIHSVCRRSDWHGLLGWLLPSWLLGSLLCSIRKARRASRLPWLCHGTKAGTGPQGIGNGSRPWAIYAILYLFMNPLSPSLPFCLQVHGRDFVDSYYLSLVLYWHLPTTKASCMEEGLFLLAPRHA